MISDEVFDYGRACDYIEDAAKLGSRPGLERIRALCAILGDPQDMLSFIHVAGTNGKGSTSCFIGSILAEGGLKVGMYNSPSLCGIRDHYRINGRLISEKDYAACVYTVAAANEEMIKDTGDGATQFELETAVAFVYFQKSGCDLAVFECGMGGRDDATNIIRKKICCVITSVSYDHMQYLGNTLSEIATVKAGIITDDCPVIAIDSGKEVRDAIEKRCNITGSPLHIVKKEVIHRRDMFPQGQSVTYEEFHDHIIGLNGAFQAENAALALRTVSVIRPNDLPEGCRIDAKAIRAGLKKARWPYRFEPISTDPLIIVDGAHNADAAQKLRTSMDECLAGYEVILVMGVFADKEYEKVIKNLAGGVVMIIATQTPDNERALPAAELAECARRYCDDVRECESVDDAAAFALQAAKDRKASGMRPAVVACGSLSYLDLFKNTVLKAVDL